MSESLPLVQFATRPGCIDLAWGHPDPVLLPVEGLKSAASRIFELYGPDVLNYGYAAGPGPLIEWLCRRLPEVDARAPKSEEIIISAGTSQALDQVATLFAAPGDAVLVESPTYHLAVRIFHDHPLELVPIPSDREGLLPDAVEEQLHTLRKANRKVAFLYTVPTFHNPTGATLPLERRRRLVEIAAGENLLIVEDDAYRELSYDDPPPPSLWSLAPPGSVIRLGSFAKSLAPGLRSGFITADSAIASRIFDSGVLDSGGGISHFSSLLVAEFAGTGEYAENVDRLRDAYRARRNTLLAALSTQLTDASWTTPHGGYFVWLELTSGPPIDELMTRAMAEGTAFMPGSAFYLEDAKSRAIRLSFSRYPPEQLAEAARRLGIAIRRL